MNQAAEPPSPNTFRDGSSDLQSIYRAGFWAVAVATGFLRAWNARLGVTGDGVSYLDLGDAYFRDGWRQATNACWSPLYAWLIVLPGHLFSLSIYWESRMVH